MTPPCGTPCRLGKTRRLPPRSSSTTGASSHWRIRCNRLPSLSATRHQLHQPVMGNGVEVFRQVRIHHFQPSVAQRVGRFRPGPDGRCVAGRNPYERGWKSASKMGPSTSSATICTTRSLTVGMPSGRWPPLLLGNVNPPHRRWADTSWFASPAAALQPLLGVSGCRRDGCKALPVHPGRTAVAHDQPERMLQQVAPCQFTIEAPEPVARFGLGLAIERVVGDAGAFPGLLSLASHLPLLLSATTRANKQRPFAPNLK